MEVHFLKCRDDFFVQEIYFLAFVHFLLLELEKFQKRPKSQKSNLTHCQDRFFTDLISTRGLGVRGWPSGKTKMLRSIVVLPE